MKDYIIYINNGRINGKDDVIEFNFYGTLRDLVKKVRLIGYASIKKVTTKNGIEVLNLFGDGSNY